MSIEKDLEFARVNCERLITSFPEKLARQEASIHGRLAAAKISPLKKLAAVYDMLDSINAHIHKVSPCRKGCSSCCHYAVSISEIEIQFIEAHSKHRRSKAIFPKRDFHGTACPFLSDNECSIYSVRPYLCRRHHSLAPDAQWCMPDVAFEGSFARLESSELELAVDQLRAGSISFDIRQIFTS